MLFCLCLRCGQLRRHVNQQSLSKSIPSCTPTSLLHNSCAVISSLFTCSMITRREKKRQLLRLSATHRAQLAQSSAGDLRQSPSFFGRFVARYVARCWRNCINNTACERPLMMTFAFFWGSPYRCNTKRPIHLFYGLIRLLKTKKKQYCYVGLERHISRDLTYKET